MKVMPAPERQLYQASADLLVTLPIVLREVRAARGQTMRQVEKAAGVSVQTLNRIEAGLPCTTTTAVKLLRWIAS